MKYPEKVSRANGDPSRTPQSGPFYKGVDPVIGGPGAARKLPQCYPPVSTQSQISHGLQEPV